MSSRFATIETAGVKMEKKLTNQTAGGVRVRLDDTLGASRLPWGYSNRQIVDHPEGGTAYADCGLCPGCENKDRLDQQELELWVAA